MIRDKMNSMSRDIMVCFFLVFLFSNAAAQQEFFGDQSGFTLGYLKGFPPDGKSMHGFAFGVHTSGISISANVASLDNYFINSLALSYFLKSESDESPSATIGLSYSIADFAESRLLPLTTLNVYTKRIRHIHLLEYP